MKKHTETIIHSVDRHPHFQKKTAAKSLPLLILNSSLQMDFAVLSPVRFNAVDVTYINLYHLSPSLFMYMNLWRFTEGSWGVDQVGEGWWKRSGQWWNSWITCKKNGNSTKGSCTDHFSLGNAAGVLDLGLVKQGLRPVLLGGVCEIQPYPIHKMVEVNPIIQGGSYLIPSYPILPVLSYLSFLTILSTLPILSIPPFLILWILPFPFRSLPIQSVPTYPIPSFPRYLGVGSATM